MISLAVVGWLILSSIFADQIVPFTDHYEDVNSQDGPPGIIDETLGLTHWLGTDDPGRDIFSRLVYGVRVSLAVGLAANMIIVTVVTAIGLIAGFWGGIVDNLLMRLTDIMYSFPGLLFVLVLVATFGRSAIILVLALGLVNWATIARIVRGQVMQTKELDYMLSAQRRCNTTRNHRSAHPPNILGPLIVLSTLMIPGLITAEASLSFLGVGIDPSIQAWVV